MYLSERNRRANKVILIKTRIMIKIEKQTVKTIALVIAVSIAVYFLYPYTQ